MNEAVKTTLIPSEAMMESLCCALLREEKPHWPYGSDQAAVDRMVGQLLFHGTDALVFEKLLLLQDCPELLRTKLREHALARAAWELRERNLLRTALTALAKAGVDALLYKGAALAYSLYHNPVTRTRSDSDVLVPEQQLAKAIKVLQSLGYRQCSADDEMIFYKLYFTHVSQDGNSHHIDLHWRLNNSIALAGVFSFKELDSRAHTLPALAPVAKTISNVDALLIACLHRGVHQQSVYTVNESTRYTGDRLIWLYDIDLLARLCPVDEWQQFCQLARAKGLTSICKEGLLLAQRLFNTPLPADWQAAFASDQQALPDRYLAAGPLLRLWLDLLASRGVSSKLAYCAHVLFPSAAYMRRKYAAASIKWLPWLYVRRALAGLGLRMHQGRR